MPLKKASDFASGGFFSPDKHTLDKALLFEPKSWRHNPDNTFGGKIVPRDEVTCDIVIFPNSESLATGKPTILKGVVVGNAGLTNALKRALESDDDNPAIAGVVEKTKTRTGNNIWVLNDLPPDVVKQVTDWYTARAEAYEKALASVPDFD